MSGHSKWATIKHKKGAADARRGKIFTKLIREIMVAAKLGGELENPRLRTAVMKARAANMPKDTIERAIKKGMGELGATEYFENLYEGYAPGGVAVMVETLTDNKNRTAAEMRSIFSKAGGNLGDSGCVSYLFNKRALFAFESSEVDEEALFEAALELGVEDVLVGDESIEIIADPGDYEATLEGLGAKELRPRSSEITLIANSYINLDDEATRRVLRLLDALDDNDDVQNVSSNLDIPDNFDSDG